LFPAGTPSDVSSPSKLSPIMVGNGPPPLMPPAAGSCDSAEAPSGIAHPVSMPSPPLNMLATTVEDVTCWPA